MSKERKIWCPDKDEIWQIGTIISQDNERVLVALGSGDEVNIMTISFMHY